MVSTSRRSYPVLARSTLLGLFVASWLAVLAGACGGEPVGRISVSYTHLTLPTKA